MITKQGVGAACSLTVRRVGSVHENAGVQAGPFYRPVLPYRERGEGPLPNIRGEYPKGVYMPGILTL
jgi:hypothetical protein